MKLIYNKVSETMKGRVHPRVKPNGKDTTMNKILIAGCTFLTAFAAVAMPNKKELAKAQRLVDDVTSADLKALKAGTTTAKDVAGTHMQLAGKAESQAEKYLLYQGAFKLYARSEEYDLAADALRALNNEVKDVPPEVIVEVVGKEMRRVAGKKAPRVLTIFKQAKRSAKYRKEIAGVEKALKAKPHDTELNRKYGECLAELERWDEAIMAFAKSAGEVAKIAAGEANGTLAFQQCADFWWSYGKDDEDDTYKVHAAELYQKGLANSDLTGLSKARAEQRVREVKADSFISVNESKYPMALNIKVEDCTNEFVRIDPRTFEVSMGVGVRPATVRVTRPYYISSWPITSGFWKRVTGNYYDLQDEKKVGLTQEDRYPIDRISPSRADDFCRTLTEKVKDRLPRGYVVRPPTRAEWELAVQGDGMDSSFVALARNESEPAWYSVNFDKVKNSLFDRARQKYGEDVVKGGTWSGWAIKDCTMKTPTGIYGVGFLPIISLDRYQHTVENRKKYDEAQVFPEYESSTDPFCWLPGFGTSVGVIRPTNVPGGGAPNGYGTMMFGSPSFCYLCIGPDLVKEWNDKHKSQK